MSTHSWSTLMTSCDRDPTGGGVSAGCAARGAAGIAGYSRRPARAPPPCFRVGGCTGLGARLGLGVELGPHLDKLVELFHGHSRVHVARGELMEVLEDDRREELRAGADDVCGQCP